ncbi:MAG: FadR family transcriptional regulator [Caulobacteraceae bacterium]|nr:FadR family transcriptional regulator [Caulobacteraceae bacterium]
MAASIRKMIIRGEVKEGDFLQPEAQLMQHFGTSRPTIREAFRILENEQLISVFRGSRTGALVHAPSVSSVTRYAGFALQAQGTLLSDIYLARLAVEPFAVRLLAESKAELPMAALRAELDDVYGLQERYGGREEFRVAIFHLHHSIVSAAGSNTLTLISEMIRGVAAQHMSKLVVRDDLADADRLRRYRLWGLRSFNKLFDLLEARDADGAEAHWRTHIRNANQEWLLGYGGASLVDVLD